MNRFTLPTDQAVRLRAALEACSAVRLKPGHCPPAWFPETIKTHCIANLTAAHAKALEDGRRISERLAMAHEYIRGEWKLNRLQGPMGDKLINSLNEPIS